MMSSMNTVMELFGDAVGFIDQSLALQENILSDTANVKYNMWTRITTHFRNKRIIRNNVNRLTAISSNILMKYKMANDMSSSLQKVSTKLKSISKKMTPKKSSGSRQASNKDQYSDASKFLADRRVARGEAPAAYSAAPASAPAAGGSLDVSGI